MTTLRISLPLALLLLAACTAETGGPSSQTSSTTSPQLGTPTGSASADAPASGPLYSVSCTGDVTKPASAGVIIEPKCVGGPPGTNCGGPPAASCAAQDVKLSYAPPAMKCVGTDVYEWNGAACVAHSTHGEGGMLKCSGKDCEALFKTKDACDAHLHECLSN